GMKSKLLTEGKLRELLEVKSIPEMIQLLEESEYREDFIAMSTKYSGMELVMRALHNNFKSSLQKLVQINPEEGKIALRILLQEYEIQNINTIIAAKATETPISDTDLLVLEKNEAKLVEKLLALNSVQDVVKKLRSTEYSAAIKKADKEFEKQQDFRVYGRALNGYYFEKLQGLPRGSNELLWKLIDLRNGVRTIMIILRIKKSAPEEDVRKYLIDRNDKFGLELSKMTDFEKIMERVAQKKPELASAVKQCHEENSLIPLEIGLEREFVKKVLRLLKLAVLDFAVVLGYLYLKELEVSAIRKIAYAKQYDFTDELKGMVFSFNA
ncbi:MAG: V-type ATPase subunit, partial [Candidatus Micrarchaeota archaeon]